MKFADNPVVSRLRFKQILWMNIDKTIVRDLKSDLHDTSFKSSPHCSSQEPFAYNESLQNPTIAVC